MNLINPKPFFIFCLCIATVSQARSQAIEEPSKQNEDEKHFRIGINAGLSFASGSFSEDDANVESSAYAEKRGSSLQLIELVYTLKPQFKAKVFYLRTRHDIATEEMSRSLSNNSFSYEITASGFETNAFVFGLGFSIPGSASTFDLFFLTALGKSFAPTFNLLETNLNDGSSRAIIIDSQDEGVFGVGLNPSVSVHLNTRLDFTAQLAYLVFEKKFESLRINQSFSSNNFNYGYEAFNLNFGFSYRL